MLAAVFVGLVVHVSAANQCPASALGACARLHLEFMRSRTVPLVLVAPPMRATTDRG
jgi:hypothetical protein